LRTESDVAAAVADAHRREWAFVLAATVRVTRNIDLAEECVQDAYATALTSWARSGIPDKPGLWLSTAARRRAVDVLRRDTLFRRALPLLIEDDVEPDPASVVASSDDIKDDRLRLIFVCCHPALSREVQVALTMRLICGLTTAEVARAFLVKEATMAARITRAKAKIEKARIPYAVPAADELPARIAGVLDVVHLVFTTGHTAPVGAELVRRDLVTRALDLARMLGRLMPGHPGVAGLLALLLLTDARRATRLTTDGRLQLLADQDRTQWDQEAISQGITLVHKALATRPPGRFALMAAIAAVHAEAPSWSDTDWREIVGLYDVLVEVLPSPVVALNRAVAVGFAFGAQAGLDALDALADEPQLAAYGYTASSRADMLRRLGRHAEARSAYEEALLLTENEVERSFLLSRLAEL
jgi:RNA polymerase sigma-70 factor (ECF subfamily)